LLEQSQVLKLFEYKDGFLYCKEKTNPKSNKLQIGERVGSLTASNYFRTKINYKEQFVHKIIFLMHYGYTPKIVDHIDGDTTNNKIENLRAATISQNQHNRSKQKNNTSGFKNVSWCKRTKKWQVNLAVNGKSIGFGRFDDIELADLVAKEVRDKYHKEFAKGFICFN